THSNLLRATGLPLAAIDAEHFQVRCIPQLATTELAETKERKRTGMAIPESWAAIARLQRVLGQLQGSCQDHLRQVRQCIRKYAERPFTMQEVSHINTKQLLIFEGVEGVFAGSRRHAPLHTLLPACRQIFLAQALLSSVQVLEDRQECIIVQTQEIFPQEVAAPQHRG